ncbi:general odorant-binding protein 56h [Bactrocera tryoni]|uniref:general odorant-binding protein 56h n=1 Tax=Bactrocera tryoni TaxID=59916 RepID=UPI001A967D1F|nr:general odorant-binding protein 56h [Bactrocera tryoni]
MKTFVTIALLVIGSAVVLCNPHDPEMRAYIEECNKEHNVSPKDFHDFIEGKLTTVPDNIKCSSQCILVKQGFMDESGNFKPDAAKAKVNDDKFVAAVDECKDLSGSTPCDTAFKITSCMLSKK